jgi:shikimate kinase
MRLIFLYGPPAAGKYTLAKLASERTGFPLFHNHVTLNMLTPMFKFGTPEFFKLSDKIRLDVFEEAARQNIPGLVFTWVYNKAVGDDEFARQVQQAVTSHGGEVKFIQIYCDKDELLRRVNTEHRKDMQKLADAEELRELLENKGDFLSPLESVPSVRIDNTHLSVEEALAQVLSAAGI